MMTCAPHRPLRSCIALAALLVALVPAAAGADGSFIGSLRSIRTIASTVPTNGDLNPYGVAEVPESAGKLIEGAVLVSNFNDSSNAQGTGTTIVQVTPGGEARLFAQINPATLPGSCPGGVGLTTALVALRRGWVIVGSLPTTDGSSATAQAGCLLVLDKDGRVVETIAGGAINGPWDMTALDRGDRATLFVTNVLNGTVANSPNPTPGGTVLRLELSLPWGQPPRVTDEKVIGSGFLERTDSTALVVGPTGVGLAPSGVLYVADSVGNRIAAIPDAIDRASPTAGATVSAGDALNDPLGLAIAPDGDILTTNGGDGNLVETRPDGAQVAVTALDTTPAPPGLPGNGALFGLAVASRGQGVYFVDDADNTLKLLRNH